VLTPPPLILTVQPATKLDIIPYFLCEALEVAPVLLSCIPELKKHYRRPKHKASVKSLCKYYVIANIATTMRTIKLITVMSLFLKFLFYYAFSIAEYVMEANEILDQL
jgi:hypothetical protein